MYPNSVNDTNKSSNQLSLIQNHKVNTTWKGKLHNNPHIDKKDNITVDLEIPKNTRINDSERKIHARPSMISSYNNKKAYTK